VGVNPVSYVLRVEVGVILSQELPQPTRADGLLRLVVSRKWRDRAVNLGHGAFGVGRDDADAGLLRARGIPRLEQIRGDVQSALDVESLVHDALQGQTLHQGENHGATAVTAQRGVEMSAE
jgi:hypothetical protein